MKNKHEIIGNVTAIHCTDKKDAVHIVLIDTEDLEHVSSAGNYWNVADNSAILMYTAEKKALKLGDYIASKYGANGKVVYQSRCKTDNRKVNLSVTYPLGGQA